MHLQMSFLLLLLALVNEILFELICFEFFIYS